MKFTKMHGCGNDYIYIDTSREPVSEEKKPELAIRLSDRHKGIGSDGIIFINPADKADFEMEIYNADGSKAQMCGNGIRCVGKYVYDHKMTSKGTVDILTGAGIKRLELKVSGDKAYGATVNMGAPVLEMGKIPAVIPGHNAEDRIVSEKLTILGKTYDITCVSMGNPHCVVFTDEPVEEFDLEKIGPEFERASVFPERINTEFVNVKDRSHLVMRVWERGSAETLACGTGASAVCVAAVLNGLCEKEVNIKLMGGELDIKWAEDGAVYMTGPAETVYEGEVYIN